MAVRVAGCNNMGRKARGNKPQIDPKFLEILACPLTHGSLKYDAENQELISKSAGLAYPLRDGIAVMLPSEARRLED